jgi:acyl dehydratase
VADSRIITLEHTPNLSVLFARAALRSLRPAAASSRAAARQADPACPAGEGVALADVEVRQAGVRIERSRLAAYDRVCGFVLGDVLPPTYLHVLVFPLQVALMTGPGFPLPLPGLVHIRNAIHVHRPVHAGEILTLSSRAESLRPHATGTEGAQPRGAQVDLVSEARVGQELVWEGASTYLARGVSVPGQPEPSAPLLMGLPADAREGALWRVPADLGRRYASVSGDVNPIHLSSLAARAMGFRRALAHGMWTKAHALAALESRLPAAYAVDVELSKPLFLPSVVNLVVAAQGTGWGFVVRPSAVRPRERTGDHLRGTLRPL